MPAPLIAASLLITLALLFYSLGVWSERFARCLKPWHVASFWAGFLFDVSGTWMMHQMAEGRFDLTAPHTLTGQAALWLMFVHAVWATSVSLKGSDKARSSFHGFSLIVWLIWLIPYFGGMYMGMNR